jgi:hypothetical protein
VNALRWYAVIGAAVGAAGLPIFQIMSTKSIHAEDGVAYFRPRVFSAAHETTSLLGGERPSQSSKELEGHGFLDVALPEAFGNAAGPSAICSVR